MNQQVFKTSRLDCNDIYFLCILHSAFRDKKKKKKKNKAKEIFEEATKSTQKQQHSGNESDNEDQGEASGSSFFNEQRQQNVSRKTAAELAFEKAQEKRVCHFSQFEINLLNTFLLGFFYLLEGLKLLIL